MSPPDSRSLACGLLSWAGMETHASLPAPPTTASALLRARRFGPLFLTQLLGAFNDNLLKNALVAAIAFGTLGGVSRSAGQVSTLVNLSAGIFILPFFLFSALAGQLADRFDKASLVRTIKLVEIGIMLLAALGFALHSMTLLFVVVFLMGTHSAFFGPLKYAILPQHLAEQELVTGNGLVGAGTFVAIVTGTLAGTLLPASVVVVALVAVALVGYASSRRIPEAASTSPVAIRWNPLRETVHTLRLAATQRMVFLAILAISWFWFYGALYLAQLPTLAVEVIGGGPHAMAPLLVAFTVGVGVGSLACGKLAHGRVEPGWIFLGCLGLSVFGVDAYAATAAPHPITDASAGLLHDPTRVRLLVDLCLLGVCGGLYVVPLYAFIQHGSDSATRARTMAANNIANALFMVGGAALALAFGAFGIGARQLLLFAALANLAVVVAIALVVRYGVLRFFISALVHTFYRVAKKDLHHIPQDAPAVLVCNHPSLMDAPLIAAVCDRPVRFVMHHRIHDARGWRWLFRAVGAIPIASRREDPVRMQAAFDAIEHALRQGEVVCIFPEGGLTKDGEVSEFRRGVEEILGRVPVPTVPMALRGMWGSVYSRARGAPLRGSPRGFRSPVEVVCGEALAASEVSAPTLRARVAALRGHAR